MAIAACVTQYEYTHEPTPWELACAALESECDFEPPEVVRGSSLVPALGAMGVFVYDEWRIYMAPIGYVVSLGYRINEVEFHESIHAILHKEQPELSRCESEARAREETDKQFGGNSADPSWRIVYGCVSPSQLL